MQKFSFGPGRFSSSPPEEMSFVLFIEDCLTGKIEVVNRLFSSVQEANQYVAENKLILHQIVSEQQYQTMVQNYQQQRQLQRNQRPQSQYQQYPNERILIQEIEEPEPSPQPRRLPKPVGFFVNPKFAHIPNFHPKFVVSKKRVR